MHSTKNLRINCFVLTRLGQFLLHVDVFFLSFHFGYVYLGMDAKKVSQILTKFFQMVYILLPNLIEKF